MNKAEKETIYILKRTIKNSDFCDSIGIGQIEILLNLIDKLQKENAELKEEIKDLIEENHKHIDYIADMKKKHEDKKKADMNKLINYIAIRENKTHEEVCKEFEV